MHITQSDKDYYIIYDWSMELIYWLEKNTKSYHTLPIHNKDLEPQFDAGHFMIYLIFDDPVDEIAFKLRWI